MSSGLNSNISRPLIYTCTPHNSTYIHCHIGVVDRTIDCAKFGTVCHFPKYLPMTTPSSVSTTGLVWLVWSALSRRRTCCNTCTMVQLWAQLSDSCAEVSHPVSTPSRTSIPPGHRCMTHRPHYRIIDHNSPYPLHSMQPRYWPFASSLNKATYSNKSSSSVIGFLLLRFFPCLVASLLLLSLEMQFCNNSRFHLLKLYGC